MLKLVIVSLLASLLVACPNQDPYAGRHDPNADLARQGVYLTSDVMALSPQDPNGVSKNTFTVDLKPRNQKWIKVFMPFHFNSGNYTRMTVMPPSLKADGCTKTPEVAKWAVPDSTGKITSYETTFFYNKGPKMMFQNGDMKYEEEKSIDANSEENIGLVIDVDGACTQLHGEFDVQFK